MSNAVLLASRVEVLSAKAIKQMKLCQPAQFANAFTRNKGWWRSCVPSQEEKTGTVDKYKWTIQEEWWVSDHGLGGELCGVPEDTKLQGIRCSMSCHVIATGMRKLIDHFGELEEHEQSHFLETLISDHLFIHPSTPCRGKGNRDRNFQRLLTSDMIEYFSTHITYKEMAIMDFAILEYQEILNQINLNSFLCLKVYPVLWSVRKYVDLDLRDEVDIAFRAWFRYLELWYILIPNNQNLDNCSCYDAFRDRGNTSGM